MCILEYYPKKDDENTTIKKKKKERNHQIHKKVFTLGGVFWLLDKGLMQKTNEKIQTFYE